MKNHNLMIIGSLSVITLSLMDNHFEKYVKERQEETLNQYVDSLELLYTKSHKEWELQGISEIGEKAFGTGIKDSDVEHIFYRLNMADPLRSSKQSGQGIALAIVKNIVKAHSGSISVTRSLGKESSFVVKLPL